MGDDIMALLLGAQLVKQTSNHDNRWKSLELSGRRKALEEVGKRLRELSPPLEAGSLEIVEHRGRNFCMAKGKADFHERYVFGIIKSQHSREVCRILTKHILGIRISDVSPP